MKTFSSIINSLCKGDVTLLTMPSLWSSFSFPIFLTRKSTIYTSYQHDYSLHLEHDFLRRYNLIEASKIKGFGTFYQHILSTLKVVPQQLWTRLSRTTKPKGQAQTNSFCPLTPEHERRPKQQKPRNLKRSRGPVAEDGGFEPPRACTQHAFQACAIGH